MNIQLKVDLDMLDYEGGIAKIAVFHGNPPHSPILYVDANGAIRGAEVAELALLLEKKGKNYRERN